MQARITSKQVDRIAVEVERMNGDGEQWRAITPAWMHSHVEQDARYEQVSGRAVADLSRGGAAMSGTIHSGRVGFALRGASVTGVLCWPHVRIVQQQAAGAVVLFRIKQTGKPCNLCAELRKKVVDAE